MASRSRIRVAHVALQLDTGGLEKLLVDFGRLADRDRFDLTFICLGRRGKIADEIAQFGWPIHTLGKGSGFSLAAIFRLVCILRSCQVDVLHTHNIAPLVYGSAAALLGGVKGTVHTRHGQEIGTTARQKKLFRLAALVPKHFVCVSRDSGRLTVKDGVAKKKIAVIWNGIDVERFAFRDFRPQGPAVMVGRLVPTKDVATLLQAVALVVQKDPTFKLEIAGDGPESDNLRSRSRELGLVDNVEFLGEVQDVAGLLSRASFFVLASISEGISLTILEAMARGVPVITTRVGGSPEIVEDGVTGFLVPARSPVELAEKILYLRSQPDAARRMGLVGRQRIEQCFDVRRMVRDYEHLYQDVAR